MSRPTIHGPTIHRLGHFELLQAVIGSLIDIPRVPIEPGTLLADLRLDDLDKATIAVELDMALSIEIPDDHVEKWLTLSDIVATCNRLAPLTVAQPEGQVA